jgi:hypothetical protein
MKRSSVLFLLTVSMAQAELIQHLDATVSASITTDASSVVSQWDNQSPSGNDTTPSDGSAEYRGDSI